MFTIRIVPGSSTPLYQQIVTQVRMGAATGVLAPGELLPSVRALADQLLINANTVAKAYGELSRDGLIETLPGKGLAVAPRRNGQGLTKTERMRRMDGVVTAVLQEAVALDVTLDEVHELIDKKWKNLMPESRAG